MDIMLDLETLGKKPGCVVLSIGAIAFDPMSDAQPGPYTFYRNIDVFSSLMLGLEIDPDTLSWWRGQSTEAKDALFPAPSTLAAAVSEFNTWIKNTGQSFSPNKFDLKMWAKSPDFDLTIWEHCARLVGIEVPWIFRDKHDVRTICAIPERLSRSNNTPSITNAGVYHNALDDCLYQAKQVQDAFKGLKYDG